MKAWNVKRSQNKSAPIFSVFFSGGLLFASHALGMEMACHKGLSEGSLLKGLRKTISIINSAVLVDTGSQVVSYCLAI